MTFILGLVLLNVGCFLLLYLLGSREEPNPFRFIRDTGIFSRAFVRHLYARKHYTDPWRINFDISFLLLVAAFFAPLPRWVAIVLGAVLAFGIIEILYTSIMQVIFRRAPSLASDLALLRTGWSVAHRYRYLFALAAVAALALIVTGAQVVVQYLLAIAPSGNAWLLVVAALLVPPCLHNWRRFHYPEFLWRVCYSPLLHFLRNIEFSRRTRKLLQQDAAHFRSLNRFTAVDLVEKPNIVILCIESYGGIVYTNPALHAAIQDRVAEAAARIGDAGFAVASTLSAAPIFAGGSWLSYTSFTYGTRIDDAYVYDGLFSADSHFAEYESLFHVLERNGYANNLLCPLGGVSSRYVNWDAINRVFRPQRKFEFDDIDYRGAAQTFFVPNDLYAAPDQYALNFAYDALRRDANAPVALFFCTLNSHYPWSSSLRAVDDWQSLNGTSSNAAAAGKRSSGEAYASAIAYQLDYLSRFVASNADDNLLLIAFGDHQPPILASESDGTHTPVHVIARNPALVEHFTEHGFARAMDLAAAAHRPIQHEGFLSLLMGAMNRAYGTDSACPVEFVPSGAILQADG